MSKVHSLPKSFGYAWDGIFEVFKSEPNFKIHITVGSATLVAGLLLEFNRYEWVALIILIGSVLSLELVNTAIETVVDMVSPEYNIKAKLAKDIAAGAVLISTIVAVIAGIALFLPKIGGLF